VEKNLNLANYWSNDPSVWNSERYEKYSDQLNQLTDTVEEKYRQYRAAIRNQLYV